MDEHLHHEDLIKSLTEEYKELLENSEQGIYFYLDDVHKVCNKNFAELLGYDSENDWVNVTESFPEAFVAEVSQETLISAYQEAMEKGTGSVNKIVWKKKDGGSVDTKVILVPIVHKGHLFALHFVAK